jgi:hypothetical protein
MSASAWLCSMGILRMKPWRSRLTEEWR